MSLFLFVIILTYVGVFTETVAKSTLDHIIYSHWEKFQKSELAKEFQNNDKDRVRPNPIHVCEHDSLMKRSNSPYSEKSRQKLEDYLLQKKRTLQATEALNTTITAPHSQPQHVPSPSSHAPSPSSHAPSPSSHSPSPSSHSPSPSSLPSPPVVQNSSSIWAPIRMYANMSWVSTSDPLSCTSVGQVVQVDQYYTNANGVQTNMYTCQSTDLLTPAKVSYLIDNIIPAILSLVNQIISVQPVKGNLVLSAEYHAIYGNDCRTNIVIPTFMIDGPGIPNADYYLMVSARPNPNPDVLANALPCSNYFIGNRFDKPLAGSINFNPGSSALLDNSDDSFVFAQNVKTGLHEVTHALGFTSDLYIDYRTPEGGFYVTPIINSTYNVVGQTWKMITPRVLAFAQQHYDCSSLDGMELEEWGVPPTQPGSHWEERLVDSEYMAGISHADSQLSYLTLYLFEDMGWYQSNTSMAEPWHYGVKEGCDWVQQPCSAPTWNRYWCDVSGANACNGHRTARGYCNLYTYSSALPVQFQYFPQSADMGGSDNWNNYCPVYDAYSNTYCHDPDGQIAITSNPYGEVYGPGSSCWDMTNAQQPCGCFPTRCSVEVGSNMTVLTVNIDGNWMACPTEGGELQVALSSGTITLTCPFVEFFCSELPGSAAIYSFDPSQNVPVPNAPPTGPRSPPFLPDNPLIPPGNPLLPPGGIPALIPPSWNAQLDQWGLTVGSTLFWIIIGIGIFLVLLVCFGCCCHRSRR